MVERPQELSEAHRSGDPRPVESVDDLSERDPEALRREIASTRDDMGQTLDEIEDRVRPRRIVERRTAQARSRLARFRDSVMGRAEDVRERASEMTGETRGQAGGMVEGARQRAGDMAEEASGMVQTVENAPDAALDRTRGNPLGAGLVAFGAGVVAAGLLPDTRSEQRVAEAVTDRFEQPVKDQLGEAASDIGEDLSSTAKAAAQRTAEHAREEAQEATQEMREEATEGSREVREQVSEGAQDVRQEVSGEGNGGQSRPGG